MKRLIAYIVILTYFGQLSHSQVTRENLAVNIYESLFDNIENPEDHIASNFPNPYIDLQNPSDYLVPYVNVLCHLEFGDGISVFDRNLIFFSPNEYVNRSEMVKVVMEAFNLPIADNNDTSPYDDVSNPYVQNYYHIVGAWQLGMLPNSNDFNPYDYATFGFLNNLIDYINDNLDVPSSNELENLSNYFTPNNFQPETVGFLRGLEHGVFSHYAKNSFVIPDRQMNLNFSHYYSTQLVELPQSYFPIQPLGRGWTHTYNAYIIKKENALDGDDLYYIKWSDGSIHIYNDNENEYITKGVYDELDEFDGGDNIEITTKHQMHYFFERLDNSEEIFYLYRIVNKNGNQINIEYETSDINNDYRRIEWVEAPSGKKLFFHYHNNTDYIDYIEDPIGRQIQFTFNEERLRYFYDAKNQETRYYYVSNDEDALEQHQYKRFLLRKVRLPRGNVIEAEYDDNNGKLELYIINDNEPITIDVDFDYNNINPMTSIVEVPMPGGNTQDYSYEFDNNGMITQFQNDTQDVNINYPDPTDINALLPTNVSVNGLDIDYEYDDFGNITQIQKENITNEQFWYDDDNNLVTYEDANGNDSHFNYDSNGNLISIQDALSNEIIINRDLFGQVTSVTNQNGITINYNYENDGAISSITAPEGLSSSFTYDGINRLLTKSINGQTSSYSYDNNDNLLSNTNIGGLTTSFNYDENDNLVEIINANNISTTFSYNNKDQVTSETFGSLVKQYQYNDDGTLDKYIKPSGYVIQYDYLSDGKINSVGTITDIDYYNSGKRKGLLESIESFDIRYNFDYDTLNRLDEVENNETNQKVTYEYDNVGNIIEIDYPDQGINFSVHYTYDQKSRLTRLRVKINNAYTTIAEYLYRDDDLLKQIDYGNNIKGSFLYDDAGRKIGISYSIMETGNTGILLYGESIEINNIGNIENKSLYYLSEDVYSSLNTQPENYVYNDNNHLTSVLGENVEVSDDGNTISQIKSNLNGEPNTSIYYQYDVEDRLTLSINNDNTNPVTNQYDPYGNRIRRYEANGITSQGQWDKIYTWDIINNNVILEESNLGANLYHVYGATGLEATLNAETGELITYYLGDLRGNVVANVSENNLEYSFNKYDDFGNLIYGNTEGQTNVFKFLGKYGITLENPTSGHYYIKARHYDAQLGRFLTEDPIWSTNLYSYADNNPISKIDANGLSPIQLNGSIGFQTALNNEYYYSYSIYNSAVSVSVKNDFDGSGYNICEIVNAIEKIIAFNNLIVSNNLQGIAEIGLDSIKRVAIENANYNLEYSQYELNRIYNQTGRFDLINQIKIALNSLYTNDYSRNLILYSHDWKQLLYNLTKDTNCN